jgi:DNA replication protein DnaC
VIARTKGRLQRRDCERANLGERVYDATLDAIPDTCEHKGVLKTYVRDLRMWRKRGVGLFLTGHHHRGKTAAAAAVLKHALLLGFSGLFVEAAQLPTLVIGKRMFDGEQTWIERAECVDVLVLDDLGAEHAHEFGLSIVEGLLRLRHNRCRPTIVTSNIEGDDLVKRYGDGIVGVFKEGTLRVLVEGKDWRAEKAEALLADFDARRKKPS